MHYAWMVMNGYRPYRDFFENHPPGFWYLLAPLARLFDESPAYLFACRTAMFLVTLAIVFIVYKLAADGWGWVGALFSIALLNVEFIFVLKTLEVRPDQLVVLSWLLGAWFLIRSREPLAPWAVGMSGLCVGIGLLFSPKALFAMLSLGAALLLLRPTGQVPARPFRGLALFGLASLTPLACLLLLMWSRDADWPELLVRYAFLYNLAYPERISGFKAIVPFVLDAPVFWVSAGIGALLAVHRGRRAESESERRRFVILTASATGAALAQFIFIPAPYPQSALPLIAFLAILAAEWGRWIGRQV
ncbi:MAG: glycosyltransferase family 39 protein, partial [Nitrospiraceae bacterium]